MNSNTAAQTREDRMLALYRKSGSVSSQEILEADFGHWPPRGLDVVAPPGGKLKFKPGITHTIINPARWALNLSTAHMFIGSLLLLTGNPLLTALYLGTMIFYQAVGTYGYILTGRDHAGPRNIYIGEQLSLKARFNDAAAKRQMADVIAHEHTHILQADDLDFALNSPLHGTRFALNHKLRAGAGKFAWYLAGDAELQARLHVLVSHIYRQHGRLPLTKDDLYDALYSQDLRPDNAMLMKLAHGGNFMGQGTFSAQKGDLPPSVRQAVEELNFVLTNLQPAYAHEYWGEVLPRLYGRLLEYYGDSQGSARMGYGHNERLREVFYRHASTLRKNPKRIANDNLPEKNVKILTQVLKRMDPNQAEELLALCLQRTPCTDPLRNIPLLIGDKALADVVGLYASHSRVPKTRVREIVAAIAPEFLSYVNNTPSLAP